jgi:hypothetical protein
VAPTILLFLALIGKPPPTAFDVKINKNSNSTALDIAKIVFEADVLPRDEGATIDIVTISLLVGLNLVTTALIIGRIVFVRRRHTKLMGK